MVKLISLATLLLFNHGAWSQEATGRVGELSARQQQRIVERVEVLKLWSFSFGPGGAANMNNDNVMYEFTVGRHWEVNEHAEIVANLHTNAPSGGFANFTSFGLGGSWIFSTADISPIAGAELGYGYAAIPYAADKSGFSTGAHAGVRFFRTARTQMSLEAFARTILVAGVMPVDYGLALGVLF